MNYLKNGFPLKTLEKIDNLETVKIYPFFNDFHQNQNKSRILHSSLHKYNFTQNLKRIGLTLKRVTKRSDTHLLKSSFTGTKYSLYDRNIGSATCSD